MNWARPTVAIFAVPGGLTVTRRAPGSRVDGIYQAPAAGAAIYLDPVVVYTVTGRKLERLPENLRTSETIAVLSTVPLRSADAPNGVLADRFTYRGKVFEVQVAEDWSSNGGWYRSYAVKVPT